MTQKTNIIFEDKAQGRYIRAIIKRLNEEGIEAHLSIVYGNGNSLVIVLPDVKYQAQAVDDAAQS